MNPASDQGLAKALATVAANSFDSIMITSAESKENGLPITYVNPAFTELTGYSAEEVIGKTPQILQGPKTDQSVLQDLREKLDHGEEFYGKAINYRKDGSEFIMEWKVVPVHDESNKTTHFIAVQREAR
jgi:PAS domain S-box-containing protein